MENRKIIRFLAEVNQQSANALIGVVENMIRSKVNNILLLISSPGGSVFHGVSIYNFLKRAPIKVETFNFGSVDSIASVIYCSGSKRYCVPNARFLIHSVSLNIQGPASFEEKKLNEIIGGLKLDRENISQIIAENCKKTTAEVEKIMLEGKTYNSIEAMQFGLVTEIAEKLFDEGEEIIGIG
ncbi:MAG: ATP-dependent Clp protease proteolytic subunit [bacterium]|nr:ATP-dependent Clp protease proteolytic subunit [bacterium]